MEKITSSVQNIQSNIQKGINTNDDSTQSVSFGDYLNSAIQQVSDLQLESENLNESLSLGLTDNLHQVMIASEKAEMALQFTMQVRNKVMDAYQEIMRMSI